MPKRKPLKQNGKNSDPGTRERILEAADRLFGELGFEGTSTRLIAEQCEVNKALIHYHFATKQALFDAVLDRYYARLGEALQPVLGSGGSLRERVVWLIDVYVDFLNAHQAFSRMVQREIASGRHLERIRTHMLPLFQVGSGLLAAAYPGAADGALAAPQLLISFYGMIVSYFTYSPVVEGLLLDDPLSPERIAARKAHLHRMADLALNAVSAEAQAPDEHNTDDNSDLETHGERED